MTPAIGHHWQCVFSHCACAVPRDLPHKGKYFPHYLTSLITICLFTLKLTWLYDHHETSNPPCVKGHTTLPMCQVTWSLNRGQIQPHVWNPRPHFAYSLHNFYGATTNPPFSFWLGIYLSIFIWLPVRSVASVLGVPEPVFVSLRSTKQLIVYARYCESICCV